jgi:hypothetical protein
MSVTALAGPFGDCEAGGARLCQGMITRASLTNENIAGLLLG